MPCAWAQVQCLGHGWGPAALRAHTSDGGNCKQVRAVGARALSKGWAEAAHTHTHTHTHTPNAQQKLGGVNTWNAGVARTCPSPRHLPECQPRGVIAENGSRDVHLPAHQISHLSFPGNISRGRASHCTCLFELAFLSAARQPVTSSLCRPNGKELLISLHGQHLLGDALDWRPNRRASLRWQPCC